MRPPPPTSSLRSMSSSLRHSRATARATTRVSRVFRAVGGALVAVSVAGGIAACARDAELRATGPSASIDAPFMARYVALGNSITAGYQSGGINDSTQAVAYPALLARAAGTRYVAPLLSRPGCPAPFVDFLSQRRVGNGGGTDCALRTSAAASGDAAILNNVAVPGANSFDPTGLPTPAYNALHQLILGRTQVERALDADPTFATVWIGNNDVLGFALSGTTTGVTPLATFTANYAALLAQLRSRNPELKGVLIGVVDVTNAPLLVPAALLVPGSPIFSAQARGAIEQGILGGRSLQLVGCPTTTQALVSFPTFASLATLAQQLPAGAPVPFACTPTTVPGIPVPLGAAGVLDETERQFFTNTVASYNAYLRAKADSIGFAFYDPNPVLLQWRQSGQIPVFPNLTPNANAFGPFVSNDGVHPGTAAHLRVAQDLVTVINTKYGSRIPAPTLP